jgi:hypothetical protein
LGEVKTPRRWHILLSRYQCIKATSISRLGRRTGRLAAGAGLKHVFPFYFTNVSTLQGFERILPLEMERFLSCEILQGLARLHYGITGTERE